MDCGKPLLLMAITTFLMACSPQSPGDSADAAAQRSLPPSPPATAVADSSPEKAKTESAISTTDTTKQETSSHPVQAVAGTTALPAAVENQKGGSAVLRDSYYKCAEATEGETWAIQDCIEEEHGYQDTKLNNAYQKLMDELSTDKRNALKAAQRRWLIERDQCVGDEQDEGQAQRLITNHCLLELTAKRADELEAMKK